MPQKITAPKKTPASIYLLTGEDEFRKELSFKRLKDSVLGKKPDAFNYEVYYADSPDIGEIIDSLHTLPVSGTRKLVALKNAGQLKKEDKTRLAASLATPIADRIIFVLYAEETLPEDDELFSVVTKHGRVVEFPRLKADEISSWITGEFKLRKKSISRRTSDLISESCRGDMGEALSLIEQLSIFVGEKDKVTDDDVLRFVDRPLTISTFELLDSISQKDIGRTLSILRGLLRSDSNPSQIIGLLSWHISRLLTVKRMLIRKVPLTGIASSFKMSHNTISKLIHQSENFSLKQLKGQLSALLNTDLMLKTTGIRGDALLEILIAKLSSPI